MEIIDTGTGAAGDDDDSSIKDADEEDDGLPSYLRGLKADPGRRVIDLTLEDANAT